MPHLDYDDYYDTKISRSYEVSKFGLTSAILIIIIGVVEITLTVVDLSITNLTAERDINPANVYTWDENPFWSTYGKGFWVGLIMIVTGILGIVSARELTISSIYGYVIHCVTSSILNFYIVISASIPLSIYGQFGSIGTILPNYYINSLTLNSLLATFGSIGFLTTAITAIGAAYYSGLFKERRGYGGAFIENYYKSKPANVLF